MKTQVEQIENITVVTFVDTYLDQSNAITFNNAIHAVLEANKRVVFDMSRLRFVDTFGLASILFSLECLNSKGGDLKLCGLDKRVRVLLEQVRMHQIFDIFNTKEEAMHAALWECPWKLLNIVLAPPDHLRRISNNRVF
jgi:anti-sigma B factor antagonist